MAKQKNLNKTEQFLSEKNLEVSRSGVQIPSSLWNFPQFFVSIILKSRGSGFKSLTRHGLILLPGGHLSPHHTGLASLLDRSRNVARPARMSTTSLSYFVCVLCYA